MLKSLRRPRWTCPRCLHQQRRNGVSIAAAEASNEGRAGSPAPFSNRGPASFSPLVKHDDTTLRDIFDNPEIGRRFARRVRAGAEQSAGLFQNKYLTEPSGFERFAAVTLAKCHKLVGKILAAATVEEYKGMAKDMDRLSDLLCRVIDLSDFVRATHPERAFQDAASRAYAAMFEYMNKLNTATGLNDQLKRAMSMPEVMNSWTHEENKVADILIRDFSKSAIDLPEDVRRAFVTISNEIAQRGNDFVDNMGPAQPLLRLKRSNLKGMDSSLLSDTRRQQHVWLPTTGAPAYHALRQVEDPELRRELYMAHRTASRESIARLEALLKARSKLAKLAGYETYAHMALSDKMAKSPEAVGQFLTALNADIRPTVNQELAALLDLKRSDARRDNFPDRINAWDRDYYSSRLLAGLSTRMRSPDTLSAYFSVGTVFQGLSRLFDRLYGIRFVPHETIPGETWHDDVRRLDVLDELGNHVAVVYCDLFARRGKSPNPAHFTLRCSRRVAREEIEEASMADVQAPFEDSIDAATDGMAHARDPASGDIYQLPTIALICDFHNSSNGSSDSTWPSSRRQPTLLSFRDVQTLFHEMGHAVHSILGRTDLQNVAGTRCATDFAELPSVLMEHFAFAPAALALWARHWRTGAPLPFGLVRERLELDRRMQGAEAEAQILLAMLDQAYHARRWDDEDDDHNDGPGSSSSPRQQQQIAATSAIYQDLYARHGAVPEPRGTAWQGFFGHLYGYGATYYAYLFDRAIAARVWQVVFGAGEKALDRKAGEHYKNEVLRWGGSRDGWACVAGVLGEEWMADGGERAMEEVGRWGVTRGGARQEG